MSPGSVDWVLAVSLKVASLIPCQGTCLGFGTAPRLGDHKRQPTDVSLPLFLPPFSSL